jgi:hypothetical protein
MSGALGANNKEEGVSDSLGLLRQVEVPPVGDAADVYRAVWALPDRRAHCTRAHCCRSFLRNARGCRGARTRACSCAGACGAAALSPQHLTRTSTLLLISWEELLELVSPEALRDVRDAHPRNLALLITQARDARTVRV